MHFRADKLEKNAAINVADFKLLICYMVTTNDSVNKIKNQSFVAEVSESKHIWIKEIMTSKWKNIIL